MTNQNLPAVLYHGTTSRFLKQIKRNGLLPRKYQKNSVYDGEWASKDNRVYLAKFEQAISLSTAAVEKFGGHSVVFEIEIPDVSQLVPDEDVLNYPDYPAYQDPTVEKSLDALGTAAYEGKIDNQKIKRIFHFPGIKRSTINNGPAIKLAKECKIEKSDPMQHV